MDGKPARLPEQRGRRPVLERAGAGAGRAGMVRDRRAAAPARRAEGAGRRLFRCRAQIWDDRRGRGRLRRPCRGGDLDRRADRQEMGPDRRFALDRRGHLCRRPCRRRLGHRRGRIFHPRRSRPRDLRADADARRECATARPQAALADVAALGGSGGVIVVTPGGETPRRSFNTPGMYRGIASGRPPGRDLRRRMSLRERV